MRCVHDQSALCWKFFKLAKPPMVDAQTLKSWSDGLRVLGWEITCSNREEKMIKTPQRSALLSEMRQIIIAGRAAIATSVTRLMMPFV